MNVKEERDFKKYVNFNTITKDIVLYYKVVSNIQIGNIKFTVETTDNIEFNIVTENVEEFRGKILELEQSVIMEHQKKTVQTIKNIQLLDELGFKIA